jgi:hypothetical protein
MFPLQDFSLVTIPHQYQEFFSNSQGLTNVILLSRNYSLNRVDFRIENLSISISH